MDNSKMADFNKIKLVIWDLDETFWNGTLSEGEVIPNERSILLVKKLAEWGIVSSICSKEEFLKDSRIGVCIHEPCEEQFERIFELVRRTNQLNYTKRRDSREEIERIIQSATYYYGYVTVKDRNGEYGIVGFFPEMNHYWFFDSS